MTGKNGRGALRKSGGGGGGAEEVPQQYFDAIIMIKWSKWLHGPTDGRNVFGGDEDKRGEARLNWDVIPRKKPLKETPEKETSSGKKEHPLGFHAATRVASRP